MALTAERLREVLRYNPATGAWTWRVRSGGKCVAGSSAGCLDPSGYIKISVDNGRYYAHRLAFLYMTGEWPKGESDHIDRDRSNCRWSNLRDVDRVTNARNTGARRRNKLGVKGVHQLPGGSYRASIHREGRTMRLGCFRTIEEAAAAYARAGGVA